MIPLEGISAMREFLRRTSLKGDEVDAFNRCVAYLYQEEQLTRKYLADEERATMERAKAAAQEAERKALKAAEPAE